MRRAYALLAVAIVAGVGALVWWTPWESGTVPVVTLAREAFGDRPVVHVLARPASARHPVAAGDGIEIWYRGETRPSHVVLRRAAKVVMDTLQGPIEPSPLWEFVTSYRSDLAAGRFRVASEEPIEGRRVLWIQSPTLEVAIDPVSYQPLWIRAPGNTLLTRLVTAETIPFDPTDFVLLRKRKPRHL